jgi:hypothetical protein
MKLYKDDTLKEEIQTFDFGTVLAGDKQEYKFIIHNEKACEVRQLKCEINHPEVTIKKCPETLKPYEKAELIVEWAPSLTLKSGLHYKINFQGFELWS